jgi:hypothetical protein
VAELTDIVGNRTVTLRAEVSIGGVIYSDIVNVTFGNGPLSVFSNSFSPVNNRMWATDDDHSGMVGLSSSDFQSAAYCGGSVNMSAVTIIEAPPGVFTATYSSLGGYWAPGLSTFPLALGKSAQAIRSKLPNLDQLVAVAVYVSGISSDIPRKGAAMAANWPDDSSGLSMFLYQTNEIYLSNSGSFGTSLSRLDVGDRSTGGSTLSAGIQTFCVK